MVMHRDRDRLQRLPQSHLVAQEDAPIPRDALRDALALEGEERGGEAGARRGRVVRHRPEDEEVSARPAQRGHSCGERTAPTFIKNAGGRFYSNSSLFRVWTDHGPRAVAQMLRYKGAESFRQRLVFATLSGRSLAIDGIRVDEEAVGLREHEASFLRLLEKVVNGSEIRINETGSSLRYRPGIITGGGRISHECNPSRAIGYYLEPLIAIAPFAKASISTLIPLHNPSIG